MAEKRIFVSYRREDSPGHAGRLYDHLVNHFGQERVFRDIEAIAIGEDFVEAIQHAISSCDILIAVIGTQWSTIKDAKGRRRLDDPEDFVRLEIAAALERNIRVIPALVQGATMVSAEDLPPDLVKLVRRNAVEISDIRFQFDVDRLIAAIEYVWREEDRMREPPQQPFPSQVHGRQASEPQYRGSTGHGYGPEPPTKSFEEAPRVKPPREDQPEEPSPPVQPREPAPSPGAMGRKKYWLLPIVALALSLLNLFLCSSFFPFLANYLAWFGAPIVLGLFPLLTGIIALVLSMRVGSSVAKDGSGAVNKHWLKWARLASLASISGTLIAVLCMMPVIMSRMT
ncbi:toll/interleukin-1 receptor domain-containing protein [Vitiosangium sp. GDMCC 1.1324]|uniref:toll/interleukin-1 receptor domain-containing protein n=1 Tax=Vitiosangium sp. (strain GDMCC 1.1324) TaxID=2138576 RepID=UPI000D33A0B1|nr:toll/interleukin-1 receptor domain-containing protein [Vitiosangium sp. GDMCC 1.1324]PTL77852.1 hypothetical protein DAT35_42390 [Vitiosangium sp. GDMCC 1.1324]